MILSNSFLFLFLDPVPVPPFLTLVCGLDYTFQIRIVIKPGFNSGLDSGFWTGFWILDWILDSGLDLTLNSLRMILVLIGLG